MLIGSATHSRTLGLVLSLSLALVVAFWLQGMYLFLLGPLFSTAFFLLLPIALTVVVDELWTLVLTPFLFWGSAWLPMFWIDRLVLTNQQLIDTIFFFSAASILSGALGTLVRRWLARHRG